MTLVACLIGLLSVAVLGTVHHFGILLLRRALPDQGPDQRDVPHTAVLIAFHGLLVLHLTEVLLFAALYWLLLGWEAIGGFGGDWTGSAADHIVFAGSTFTTLGASEIKAQGPLRLVAFSQALGGFMVLTWSATFLYTLWSRPMGLTGNRHDNGARPGG